MEYRELLKDCNDTYRKRLILVSNYISENHFLDDQNLVITIKESDGNFYTDRTTIDNTIEKFKTLKSVEVYGIIEISIWDVDDHKTITTIIKR